DRVTRDEILRVVQVSSNLGRLSQRINPFMKTFVLKWKPADERSQADIDYFENGNASIQEFANGLSALIQRDHEAYRLTDFAKFVEEVAAFMEEESDLPEAVNRYLPVARKVKKALAGGSEDRIMPNEWRRILLLGSRAYVQYLRYSYFIKDAIS